AERVGAVRLVEGEELRAGVDGDVAAAPPEAGDADALRHVLAIVPLVEFGPALGQVVVPDRHHALSRETHPAPSAALPDRRPALSTPIPRAERDPAYSGQRPDGRHARAAGGTRWPTASRRLL